MLFCSAETEARNKKDLELLIVDSFPFFVFRRWWQLSSSSFTLLSPKPRLFNKKFFVLAVSFSSVSCFFGAVPSTIMHARNGYCWRLLSSCSRRILAFLVIYSTPSNSNTHFSSLSILVVSDWIVVSIMSLVFGVADSVFFAWVESALFRSCTHFPFSQ